MFQEPRRQRNPIREAMIECLERHGERRALSDGKTILSYRKLGERIRQTAAELDVVLKGSRRHIGFCLKNCPEYVVTYFGALEAGHLPLLMDAHFKGGEIQVIREDCGLDALVLERSGARSLAVPAAVEPVLLSDEVVLLPLERISEPRFTPRDDTRVCRFTSGTTGKPKCLEFSGHAVVSAARNWMLGTALAAEERTLCLAALSNGLAFNTSLLSTLLAGAELHFLRGMPLTRTVARRIEADEITRLVAFPTLYRNFVAPGGPSAEPMASLHHAISAGAPLWPDVREEFRDRFGIDISDYYGIAETGPCTFEPEESYHTGQGKPLPGCEIRIAASAEDPAVGEVLVRTASMASAYLNHPGQLEARMTADGFYRSGDRGKLVDGRLHLVGRTTDHINVAGRKIDPTEVVSTVLEIDGVADAVVFADEDFNRETVAHLVVVTSSPDITKADLIAACRSRLADYKVPGKISFTDAIPRTGIGKPRIAMLREQLRSGQEP